MYPTQVYDVDTEIMSFLPTQSLITLRQVNRYSRDVVDQDSTWRRRSARLGLPTKPNQVSWRDWSRVWEPRGGDSGVRRHDPIGSILQLDDQEAGIRLLAQDGIYVDGSQRYQALSNRLIGTMNDTLLDRRDSGLARLVDEYMLRRDTDDATIQYPKLIRRAIKTGTTRLIQPIVDDFIDIFKANPRDADFEIIAQLDRLDVMPVETATQLAYVAIGRMKGRYADAEGRVDQFLRSDDFDRMHPLPRLYRAILRYLPSKIPDLSDYTSRFQTTYPHTMDVYSLALEGVKAGYVDLHGKHLEPVFVLSALASKHPDLAEMYLEEHPEIQENTYPIVVSDPQLIRALNARLLHIDFDAKRGTPEVLLEFIDSFDPSAVFDNAILYSRYDLIEALLDVFGEDVAVDMLESPILTAAITGSLDLLVASIVLYSNAEKNPRFVGDEYINGELVSDEADRIVVAYLIRGETTPRRLLDAGLHRRDDDYAEDIRLIDLALN